MPVTHIPRNGLIDVTFTLEQLRAILGVFDGFCIEPDDFQAGEAKLRDAESALAYALHPETAASTKREEIRMADQPASERTDDEITERMETEFVGKTITAIYFQRGFDHDTLGVEIDGKLLLAMGPEIHPVSLGGSADEATLQRARDLAKEHGW